MFTIHLPFTYLYYCIILDFHLLSTTCAHLYHVSLQCGHCVVLSRVGSITQVTLEFHRGNRTHRAASGRNTSLLQHQLFRSDAARCVRFSRWNSSFRPIYIGQNLIDLAGIQIGGPRNIYRTNDQIPGPMVWWKSNFVHLSDDPMSDVGHNKSSPRSARCFLGPMHRPKNESLGGIPA